MKEKQQVTPRQIALAMLTVGSLGLIVLDLLEIRGWLETAFGIISVLGLSGYMATWGGRKQRR